MNRLRHPICEIFPLAKWIPLVPVTPLHATLADGKRSDMVGPAPYFDFQGLFRVAPADLNRLGQVGHDRGNVPLFNVFPSDLCDLGSGLFGHGRSFYQVFKLGHYRGVHRDAKRYRC